MPVPVDEFRVTLFPTVDAANRAFLRIANEVSSVTGVQFMAGDNRAVILGPAPATGAPADGHAVLYMSQGAVDAARAAGFIPHVIDTIPRRELPLGLPLLLGDQSDAMR